jgi:hypothetical protein
MEQLRSILRSILQSIVLDTLLGHVTVVLLLCDSMYNLCVSYYGNAAQANPHDDQHPFDYAVVFSLILDTFRCYFNPATDSLGIKLPEVFVYGVVMGVLMRMGSCAHGGMGFIHQYCHLRYWLYTHGIQHDHILTSYPQDDTTDYHLWSGVYLLLWCAVLRMWSICIRQQQRIHHLLYAMVAGVCLYCVSCCVDWGLQCWGFDTRAGLPQINMCFLTAMVALLRVGVLAPQIGEYYTQMLKTHFLGYWQQLDVDEILQVITEDMDPVEKLLAEEKNRMIQELKNVRQEQHTQQERKNAEVRKNAHLDTLKTTNQRLQKRLARARSPGPARQEKVPNLPVHQDSSNGVFSCSIM